MHAPKKNFLILYLLSLFFIFITTVSAQTATNADEKKAPNESQLSETQKQELVHLSLGESFLKDKQFNNAFEIYKRFVEMFPHNPMRFYALDKMAKIEEMRQNFFEALLFYKQLYQENILNEKGVEYLFEVARLYEKIGEYNEAKNIYRQVIDVYPDSFYAQNAQNRLALADMLLP